MKIEFIIHNMQNPVLKRNVLHFNLILIILSILFLTSCGLSPDQLSTTISTPTQTVNCFYGSWQVNDLSAFVNSFNSLDVADSPISLTDQNQIGSLRFDFSQDGIVKVNADHFVQSYTVKSVVGGVPHDIPVTITSNGKASASYSQAGKQITFFNQTNDEFSFLISTFGISENLADELLGFSGIEKTYRIRCVDTESLTLQVTAQDVNPAPITMERVP
jgi:uncharacterized lipoprotein YajG